MIRKFFFGVFWMSTLSFAAIPPMSVQHREASATYIVEGKVLNISNQVIKGDRTEMYLNRIFTAEIEVSKFVKPEMLPDEETKTIQVTYWKPEQRPAGWGGSQGQSRILQPEGRVRLYLQKGSQGLYHLLIPNGWEELGDDQEEEIPEMLR